MRTVPVMDITMTDAKSLIRLQAMLSPAFPTGAFSYSSGVEAAVDAGLLIGGDDLCEWILDQLADGPLWNDAVLLAESWRLSGEGQALDAVADLARALSFSATRHLETTAQGAAFLKAAIAWQKLRIANEACPLPVAVGGVCGKLDIGLVDSLAAFLHASVSSQIQAALRLMKLGQQAGVVMLARFEAEILDAAERASHSTLDDLGSAAIMLDIMSMQHETLESRIFRS